MISDPTRRRRPEVQRLANLKKGEKMIRGKYLAPSRGHFRFMSMKGYRKNEKLHLAHKGWHSFAVHSGTAGSAERVELFTD
jgi:hypothetical protein